MEATPGGTGISALDTDLEVDFTPPVGYAGPKAPPSTMTSKLKIEVDSSSAGSSRPSSSLAGAFVAGLPLPERAVTTGRVSRERVELQLGGRLREKD